MGDCTITLSAVVAMLVHPQFYVTPERWTIMRLHSRWIMERYYLLAMISIALIYVWAFCFTSRTYSNMTPSATATNNSIRSSQDSDMTPSATGTNDSIPPSQDVNKDLVLHGVYFDNRVQQNSHKNATVISVSVLAKYRESILSCEVDEVGSRGSTVENVILQPWVDQHRPVTHVDCFVYCYDMRVNAGSTVHVLYNKSGTVVRVPARSEVVIPNYEREEDGVMVCATGFGNVPYIDQWLIYQKTIGVQFIHIVVSPTFMVNLENSSVLQNYTSSGFVNMVVWDDLLNKSQVFYYSQSLKYQDCVLRYQGKYKYMMVLDFDEYFVPLGKTKDVLSYTRNLIKDKIGSVILSRQDFYCMGTGSKTEALPVDGNMTKYYDTTKSVHHDQGKSIHLVRAILQNSVHHSGPLLPPYTRHNYKKSQNLTHCYIAHLTHSSAHASSRRKHKCYVSP